MMIDAYQNKKATILSSPRSNGTAAQAGNSKTTPLDIISKESSLVYTILEAVDAALEAERRNLATLLESTVAESLNLLLSQMKAYEQTLSQDPKVRKALSVLSSLARQALQQAYNLETNLNPTILETFGLEAALEALVNQEVRTHGLPIALALERMQNRLPPQVELALFRVTQDTLYCAIRQAHASQITIRLECQNGQLIFSLADNGILVTGQHILPATRQRIEQLGGTIETQGGSHRGFELTINFAIERPAHLSPREMEVLQLLVEGLSNKEIAHLLSISPRTVNFHLGNIYSKLGVGSRTEAALFASRRGWVRPRTN